MPSIKFKVAAKTDVGLIRTNNEDNFQISWDLSTLPMRWVNNETHLLGSKGCLLVVADGMGGAKAGEVASQIAIDSIKSSFAPGNLSEKVTESKDSINAFIKAAILLADERIKNYAKDHPETKGMGTTIVVAWIIAGNLYIGWCGDSRAYLYNHIYGLKRLTKDHSYVQQLVDAGKLSEEEAFDFPDSNIITQCLSASPQKCRPETLASPIELSNNDTLLLCTDGLCGMIRDAEIKSTFDSANTDLLRTADVLISKALDASGSDNVTLCLFNVVDGLRNATPFSGKSAKVKNKTYRIVSGILLVLIVFIICFFSITKHNIETEAENTKGDTDSATMNITDNTATASPIDSGEMDHDPENPILESSTRKAENIMESLPQIPFTIGGENNARSEEPGDIKDTLSENEVVEMIIPDIDVRELLRDHGIKSRADFSRLNPEMEYDSLKAGDTIRVYKNDNDNNE